jgi:hypothetical protein
MLNVHQIKNGTPKRVYSIKRVNLDNPNNKQVSIVLLRHEEAMLDANCSLFKKLDEILLNRCNYASYIILFAYPFKYPQTSIEGHLLISGLSKECILHNLNIMEQAFKNSDEVICAWGSDAAMVSMFVPILYLAHKLEKRLSCFGITPNNTPYKPHYLPISAKLIPYDVL